MKKYPKVRTVGHRDIADLLIGPVVVQEKVDGSNFSFGRSPDGQLFAWSRTQALGMNGADKMFAPAIEYIKSIDKRIPATGEQKACRGIIYRCEYLQRPKHNVLAYDRVPKNHLVLYEVEYWQEGGGIVNRGNDRKLLELIANALDIDVIPELFCGDLRTEGVAPLSELIKVWHDKESFLGGPKIEGVVIKNFTQTDERTGSPYLVGKVVREEFKEVHRHQTKLEKPDPVSSIGARLGGPARWQKAYQHLAETGQLVHGMEDVPKLLKRVQVDVEMEEEDTIKEALYKLYRKQVIGNSSRGVAEWYKAKLHSIAASDIVPGGGRIDE